MIHGLKLVINDLLDIFPMAEAFWKIIHMNSKYVLRFSLQVPSSIQKNKRSVPRVCAARRYELRQKRLLLLAGTSLAQTFQPLES